MTRRCSAEPRFLFFYLSEHPLVYLLACMPPLLEHPYGFAHPGQFLLFLRIVVSLLFLLLVLLFPLSTVRTRFSSSACSTLLLPIDIASTFAHIIHGCSSSRSSSYSRHRCSGLPPKPDCLFPPPPPGCLLFACLPASQPACPFLFSRLFLILHWVHHAL